MTAQEMWDMKLNKNVIIDMWIITRVPGGWIYTIDDTGSTGVFVPKDNEFISKEHSELCKRLGVNT